MSHVVDQVTFKGWLLVGAMQNRLLVLIFALSGDHGTMPKAIPLSFYVDRVSEQPEQRVLFITPLPAWVPSPGVLSSFLSHWPSGATL